MRGMKTARALGEIDEEFITEAAPEKLITVKVFPWKYVAIASSLVLVVCIGMMVVLFGSIFDHDYAGTDSTSSQSDGQWEKKEVIVSSDDSQTDIAQLKSWKDLSLTERYPDFGDYYKRTYQTTLTTIDESKLNSTYIDPFENWLDNVNNTAFLNPAYRSPSVPKDPLDHSSPEYAEAKLYTIKNIDPAYALAVKFTEFESDIDKKEFDYYYVYINTKAQTLSLLFDNDDSIDIQNTLSFGSAYYYTDDGRTIEFEGLDTKKILDIIGSNKNSVVRNEKAEDILLMDDYKKRMDISANIELLGIKNKTFSISDNGYLVTNLFSNAWIYNIGPEAAKQVIDYVRSNCKGYEIVYKQADGDSDSSKKPTDASSSTASIKVSQLLITDEGSAADVLNITDSAYSNKIQMVGNWCTAKTKLDEEKVDLSPDGIIIKEGQTQAVAPLTNKKVTVNYTAYAIKGIDRNYACAIKFEGEDGYYAYTAKQYNSKNLEEFANAFDFRNNVVIDSAEYATKDNSRVVFYQFDKDKLLDILLKDCANDPVTERQFRFESRLYFSMTHELLSGCELSGMSVGDDGYLVIYFSNLIDNTVHFNIGTEKVKQLKEFIATTGKGYEMNDDHTSYREATIRD